MDEEETEQICQRKVLPKRPQQSLVRQVVNLLMLARNVYSVDKRLRIWKEEFEKLQLGEFDIRRMYRIFRQIDMDGVDFVNIEEMMMFFGVECTTFSKEVFSILSVNICRTLNFRDFVLCIWNFLSLNDDAIYTFGFDLYDKNNNNQLELAEVKRMLKDLYSDHFETSKRAMALYQRVRLRGERIGPQEFNEYARSNPALFFPAFDMQRKIRQQVIGIVFWKNKARVRALKCAADSCPRIKDLPDIFTQKHDSFDLEVDTTVTENSLCQNSGKGSVRGGSEPPVYPKGSPEYHDMLEELLTRKISKQSIKLEPLPLSVLDPLQAAQMSVKTHSLPSTKDAEVTGKSPMKSKISLKLSNISGKSPESNMYQRRGRRATISALMENRRRIVPESENDVKRLETTKFSATEKKRRRSVS